MLLDTQKSDDSAGGHRLVERYMDFGIVVALLMVAAGVFRLVLTRSGKIPIAFGYQRYFPYVFIGVGVILFILALTD